MINHTDRTEHQDSLQIPEVSYDSTPDIAEHIKAVKSNIDYIIMELEERARTHDSSKFSPEELPYYDKYTPRLKTLEYGSEEYKANLRELKPALDHHYSNNRHHPEHFPDGINGMNLIDVMEMVADWIAAVQRSKDGDIFKSLEVNIKRFNIGPQFAEILTNTVQHIVHTKK